MRRKRNKYIESFCFCRFLNTISCLRRSFWQARSYFCRGGTRRVSYESRTARQILCRSLRAAIRRACVTENTQPAEFISFPRSRSTVVHPSRQREKTIENSLSLSLFVIWHNRSSWISGISFTRRYYASLTCLVAILPSWWLIVHLAETTWLLLLNEFLDLSSDAPTGPCAVVALWRVLLLTGGSRALEREGDDTIWKKK